VLVYQPNEEYFDDAIPSQARDLLLFAFNKKQHMPSTLGPTGAFFISLLVGTARGGDQWSCDQLHGYWL
jgi:hypothetical protein